MKHLNIYYLDKAVELKNKVSYIAKMFTDIYHKVDVNNVDYLYWLISTLEKKYNHYYSFLDKVSVNSQKDFLPWYTYPAIEYLQRLNFKNKNIFEYGSGYSSIFWSKNAKSITSAEDSEKWYKNILSYHLKNHNCYHFSSKNGYINSVNNTRGYDVISIDGKWRLPCAKASITNLKSGGMIILDNSDWYRITAQYLRYNGFTQIDFSGFGPINNYTWTTSMFYKEKINIEYKAREKYCIPLGGQYITPKDER